MTPPTDPSDFGGYRFNRSPGTAGHLLTRERPDALPLRKGRHFALPGSPGGEGALGDKSVERLRVVLVRSRWDDVQRDRGGASIREHSSSERPRRWKVVAESFDEAAPIAG